MTTTADVVIVGAGIAGVSAAYHLAVRHEVESVMIVDPRPPMTLTSDKSTECYRDLWPNQPMVDLMSRSIDIYEELAELTDFGLNRRGYLFVTGEEERYREFEAQSKRAAELGVAASVEGPAKTIERYPFLTRDTVGSLFVQRAGWFRAQDLGQWMLDEARSKGARVIGRRVVGVEPGRVDLDDGSSISTGSIVVAAGPLSQEVAAMAGIDLPLFSELHLKVAFKDHLGIIPRNAPMTIWNDTQTIQWSDEERIALMEMGREDLLGEMPIFCHFRPEGGEDSPWIVALWEYHDQVMEPSWPLPEDPLYLEAVMRGLTTMVPGLEAYLDRLPESVVDGGYYTRTNENRPLIGPSGIDGIHLLAGYSGFGVMVSAGGADLLAAHITGSQLPDYASAFLLSRYEDPEYTSSVSGLEDGQL